MTVKSVICHDTSKIRVTDKEDTEKIVDFSLIPVCPIVQTGDTWYWGSFIRIGLDSDSGVVAYTEDVVNDFKSLVSSGEIDCCDVDYLGEFGCRVVCR
jgi:hypothetical protein